MRLLLDTHALLWFCEGSEALSAEARREMESAENEVWVSHVSAWEVAIKASLRKVRLQMPYEELFPKAIMANGWRLVAPDFRHYRELLELPFHHRDPFDRLLVAQARLENLTLVTRDSGFSAYDLPCLW